MSKKTVFGTKEWSDISANCLDGCDHNCKYCYAKAGAIKSQRRIAENWTDTKPAFKKLSRATKTQPCKVMFPTTHDILPEHLDVCIRAITKLLDAGHELLIVSKPHFECIKEICKTFNYARDRILFRFTIGSASNMILSHWEPGAPSFEERVASLKHAASCGYNTSVSCEPMLDDNIGAVITAVAPHVNDAIWLGKMNSAYDRLALNGGTEADRYILELLLKTQEDDKILALYERYHSHPKVKWKESIKSIVGIEIPTESGLDI